MSLLSQITATTEPNVTMVDLAEMPEGHDWLVVQNIPDDPGVYVFASTERGRAVGLRKARSLPA